MVEETLGYFVTFLISVICVLLGLVVSQLKELSAKLEFKVSETTCLERHSQLVKTADEVWLGLHNHSHTGLPPDSRVLR